MTTNFTVRSGKIGLFAFIRRPIPGIPNGLQYRHSEVSFVMIWQHRVKIWRTLVQ